MLLCASHSKSLCCTLIHLKSRVLASSALKHVIRGWNLNTRCTWYLWRTAFEYCLTLVYPFPVTSLKSINALVAELEGDTKLNSIKGLSPKTCEWQVELCFFPKQLMHCSECAITPGQWVSETCGLYVLKQSRIRTLFYCTRWNRTRRYVLYCTCDRLVN